MRCSNQNSVQQARSWLFRLLPRSLANAHFLAVETQCYLIAAFSAHYIHKNLPNRLLLAKRQTLFLFERDRGRWFPVNSGNRSLRFFLGRERKKMGPPVLSRSFALAASSPAR